MRVWLSVAYFGAENDNPLPCATLFTDFSESKSEKILFVWLSIAYFGWKREIHFHLQVYSPHFSESKKSPARINDKRFSRLKRRRESELNLRMADFHLFLAGTDYSLPLETLFSNFSTAKKLHSKERKQKPFAAQSPPRKRGYVEDFTLKSVNAHQNHLRLRNFKNSHFALSLKLCREIAARQARGWGWFLNTNWST